MRRLPLVFACLVLFAATVLPGCQAGRGFNAGQPFGGTGQVFQQPGVAQPGQSFGQQGFGTGTVGGFTQNLGQRFANGFANRAVGGVVNRVFQAAGL